MNLQTIVGDLLHCSLIRIRNCDLYGTGLFLNRVGIPVCLLYKENSAKRKFVTENIELVGTTVPTYIKVGKFFLFFSTTAYR